MAENWVEEIVEEEEIEDRGKPVEISREEIANWMEGKEESENPVFCGIYGAPKTVKSGLVMSQLTKEHIKTGKVAVIFDLDVGCTPTRDKYYNKKHVLLRNPVVTKQIEKDGKKIRIVDYTATMNKIRYGLEYIREKMKDKVVILAIDGLDRLLEFAERGIRVDLGKSMAEGLTYPYWRERSIKYDDVIEDLKAMSWCQRFVISHEKEERTTAKDEEGRKVEVATGRYLPAWHYTTDGKLYQCIRMRREEKDGKTLFIAHVNGFKGCTELEGSDKVVMEVENGKVKWYGFNIAEEYK